MSRPMALALVLLVLFLTSQGDWRAARQQQLQMQEAAQGLTRQQRLELHRDAVKEKIILDLTRETKQLDSENVRLRRLVEELQRELGPCQKGRPAVGSRRRESEAALLETELLEATAEGGGIRERAEHRRIAEREGTERDRLDKRKGVPSERESVDERKDSLSDEIRVAPSQGLRGHSWLSRRRGRIGVRKRLAKSHLPRQESLKEGREIMEALRMRESHIRVED